MFELSWLPVESAFPVPPSASPRTLRFLSNISVSFSLGRFEYHHMAIFILDPGSDGSTVQYYEMIFDVSK